MLLAVLAFRDGADVFERSSDPSLLDGDLFAFVEDAEVGVLDDDGDLFADVKHLLMTNGQGCLEASQRQLRPNASRTPVPSAGTSATRSSSISSEPMTPTTPPITRRTLPAAALLNLIG